jgi:hypothetical protein
MWWAHACDSIDDLLLPQGANALKKQITENPLPDRMSDPLHLASFAPPFTMKLFFHSKNPETAWLSCLSAHAFMVDRVKWPSVERGLAGGLCRDRRGGKIGRRREIPIFEAPAGWLFPANVPGDDTTGFHHSHFFSR